MNPNIPFRGSVSDALDLSASIEKMGFEIVEFRGPEGEAFNNIFILLHLEGVEIAITRDRGQLFLEMGPSDNKNMRYSPVEWLLAAGKSVNPIVRDAKGEFELLNIEKDLLISLVSHPELIGNQTMLQDARRQISDEFESMNNC